MATDAPVDQRIGRPLFGLDKPVIGMVHLPALPGTPYGEEDRASGCSRRRCATATSS